MMGRWVLRNSRLISFLGEKKANTNLYFFVKIVAMKVVLTTLSLLVLSSSLCAQGGYLGVQLQSDDQAGALISEVTEPSAAEIMGLLPGDRILTVDSTGILNMEALAQEVGRRLPGEIVRLRIRRGEEEITLRGLLGRRSRQSLQRSSPPLDRRAVPREEWKRLEELLENQGGVLEMPEFPEMPNFPDFPRMFDADDFFEGFQLDIDAQSTEGMNVYLSYPESTSEEDRERLIQEAHEKYGEDVVVEFKGRGTVFRMGTRKSFDGELDTKKSKDLKTLLEEGEFEIPQREEKEKDSVWHASLDEALKAAKKSGKPVLLDFYANWCGPCRQLGEEVLDNPKHKDLISRFEGVRINTDDNKSLAKQYGVRGIPDVRILDAGGKELARIRGFKGEEATVKVLQGLF